MSRRTSNNWLPTSNDPTNNNDYTVYDGTLNRKYHQMIVSRNFNGISCQGKIVNYAKIWLCLIWWLQFIAKIDHFTRNIWYILQSHPFDKHCMYIDCKLLSVPFNKMKRQWIWLENGKKCRQNTSASYISCKR